MKKERTKHMQYYFIGGLGGNSYHLAPLMDELGFPVTFLDPYREMIQTKTIFVIGSKVGLARLKRSAYLGIPWVEIWLVIWLLEFPQIQALILPGWGLSGYGKDPAS